MVEYISLSRRKLSFDKKSIFFLELKSKTIWECIFLPAALLRILRYLHGTSSRAFLNPSSSSLLVLILLLIGQVMSLSGVLLLASVFFLALSHFVEK